MDVARIDAGDAFSIPDPMERFMAVNQPHLRRDQHSPLALVLAHDAMRDRDRLSTAAKVLDMHYQVIMRINASDMKICRTCVAVV